MCSIEEIDCASCFCQWRECFAQSAFSALPWPPVLIFLWSAFYLQNCNLTTAKRQCLSSKWGLRKWMFNFWVDNHSNVFACLGHRTAFLVFLIKSIWFWKRLLSASWKLLQGAKSVPSRACCKLLEKLKSVASRACWKVLPGSKNRHIKSVLEVKRLASRHVKESHGWSQANERS